MLFVIDGLMDGWMDGWMDGQTDGWTDRQTDGRTKTELHVCNKRCSLTNHEGHIIS